MDLRELAERFTAIERDYWRGLITQTEAELEIAWLDLVWTAQVVTPAA